MADPTFDAYMYFIGEGKYFIGKGNDKKLKSAGIVKGETLDERFRKHGGVKILSFAWTSGQSQNRSSDNEDESPASPTLAQGLRAEIVRREFRRHVFNAKTSSRLDARADVGNITVTKEIDSATPTLFLAHAQVAVFKGMHIYFRKMAAVKPMTFCRISLSDVLISEWKCDFGSNYTETLVINFDWCQISYYPQSKEGTSKKNIANIKNFCCSDNENETAPDFFHDTTLETPETPTS